MMGPVNKIYLTQTKTHIRNEDNAEFSHCGRRISGVAWMVLEYYLKNVQRPVCKTCLRKLHKLPKSRQQYGNAWSM